MVLSPPFLAYVHKSVCVPAARLVCICCQPTEGPEMSARTEPSIEKERPSGVGEETLHQKLSRMAWLRETVVCSKDCWPSKIKPLWAAPKPSSEISAWPNQGVA